jgi:membrane protein YdbS with pleckstrin-like domain
MSQQDKIIIKTSPFVFLRRLVVIEFLFAVVTLYLAIEAELAIQVYDNLQLMRFASFGLIVAFVITIVQVVIISVAFITWYADSYEVDRHQIVRRRGNLFGASTVVQTQALTKIEVVQSRFGDMVNYGTLELTTLDSNKKKQIKNITNSTYYAGIIRELIKPQQMDVNRQLQKSIPQMIAEGEGQYIEYKSSFSWDYRRQSINRDLNKAVMKNIVAYMNTTGGVILIGVADDGEILGLEIEFKTLRKSDADGFENTFNMTFNKMVGVEYSNYVRVDFAEFDGKTVCRVVALPAPEPVFLKNKNDEEFYIRTGNSSQPLSMSQAVKYIQTHFAE